MTQNLLFVCTGNTCRSPMAEGIARHLTTRIGGSTTPDSDNEDGSAWRILSAGTSAAIGSPATIESIDAVRDFGVDISDHRSQPLRKELVEWASTIYAMTRGHIERILQIAPEARDKVYLLDPHEREIDDPIGKGRPAYDSTAAQIREAVELRLRELER
jgi:protein-tyrosine-phosphatase